MLGAEDKVVGKDLRTPRHGRIDIDQFGRRLARIELHRQLQPGVIRVVVIEVIAVEVRVASGQGLSRLGKAVLGRNSRRLRCYKAALIATKIVPFRRGQLLLLALCIGSKIEQLEGPLLEIRAVDIVLGEKRIPRRLCRQRGRMAARDRENLDCFDSRRCYKCLGSSKSARRSRVSDGQTMT